MIDNTKMMMDKEEDEQEDVEGEEVIGKKVHIEAEAIGVIEVIDRTEVAIEAEEIEADIEIDRTEVIEVIEVIEAKEVDIGEIEEIEEIEVIGEIEKIEEIEAIGEVEEEESKAKDGFIMISKQEDFLIIKRKSKHNCSLKNKVNFILNQDNILKNKLKEEECN